MQTIYVTKVRHHSPSGNCFISSWSKPGFVKVLYIPDSGP